MSNFFKDYWKNTYQKYNKDDYEIQSAQAKETFDWHKKYIQKTVPTYFNDYNPRVLDIGCSSGYLTNIFSNFSSDVVGIDYEEGFILAAKSNYSAPKFIVGNIHNLDKIDGLFDLIVCFGVTQYIDDLGSALRNLKSKYILISNHTKSKDGKFNNKDIKSGDFRRINLFQPPFNFQTNFEKAIKDSCDGVDKYLLLFKNKELKKFFKYMKI